MNNFTELSYNETIAIDGGKSVWCWIGDISCAVGTVAALGGGPVTVGIWAGVAYFYGLNRPE